WRRVDRGLVRRLSPVMLRRRHAGAATAVTAFDPAAPYLRDPPSAARPAVGLGRDMGEPGSVTSLQGDGARDLPRPAGPSAGGGRHVVAVASDPSRGRGRLVVGFTA